MLAGLALAIFAGTLWLHWPGVNGGFLTGMDDDEYLQQAVRLKGLTWDAVQWAFATTEPYYHPLPRLSHIVDYQVWGTNATGHHATNVVLHALNAALVFGFLWTLLGAVASWTTSERLTVALGVAVVFAIHPLQVESVAWISARSQLLCTAFGIGTLWAYVAGARRWVVWALFATALLSKPTAVSLLFAVLAMDYFPLPRRERLGWGQWLRDKAGLIALALAVSLATMITESHAGGLMAPLHALRPSERLFLAVQSLTFYPWKLVWPAWLSPYYPLGLGFSLRLPLVVASALCVGGVTALSVWRRRCTPALAAGWGAYVMFILPVSGLAQRGWQAVADRYAYVAMLPLLLLAGGAAVWLWRRSVSIGRIMLAGLLVCEFVFFGLRTRAQTFVWHNDETLWRGVLAQFPNSDVANNMLAQALLNQGRIPEALEYAQRAVTVAPSAETHRNLGIALTQAGRVQEAIGEFDLALRMKPDLADAHHNLALALLRLGRVPEAIGHWEQALRIEPNYAEAHCNLGVVLQRTGKLEDAIGHYEQALRVKPDYAEAHYNLGVALVRLGRAPEAIEQWQQALRINPDYTEAHCNLGVALEQSGRIEDAIEHYEQALKTKPDLAEVHYDLGVALARLGRVPQAIEHWQQALRLEPDMAAAHYNLGSVLEQAGKRDEAIEQYQQALKTKPDYTEAQNRLARLRTVQ
jgi:tetratricopeptide (TPR) repeat protein